VSAALFVALLCTGSMLVTTLYFVMGSVPLLILRHDTPMDARFVRAFFNTAYLTALGTSAITALSYAVAGRWIFAAGAAALALLAWVMRTTVLARMDALRDRIQATGADAISAFRRLHATAIIVNLAQLVLIVWCLISVSIEMRQPPSPRASAPAGVSEWRLG
jgi:hypothetical protein